MLIDPWVIDGVLVRLSTTVVSVSGGVLRKAQTGNVQVYATFFVVAAAAITGWAIWR